MIACLDVDYRQNGAVAAGLVFRDWSDQTDPVRPRDASCSIDRVEPYEPGRFYVRELPCLLAVLEMFDPQPEVIVIDGYVWLGDEEDPGLGAHLHRAIGGRSAVVGVAKTRFRRARLVEEVHRGRPAARPLYT